MTRALAVAIVVALAAGACGCGKGRGGGQAGGAARADAGRKKSGDPALDAYLDALAPLARLEDDALAAVAAHTGVRYDSDKALVDALRTTAIPKYREFVAGLDTLPAPPASRQALHDRLKVLAAAELKALERLADAIDKGDGAAVIEVNAEQRRLADELDAVVREWRGGPAAPPPGAPASSPSPARQAAPAAPFDAGQ